MEQEIRGKIECKICGTVSEFVVGSGLVACPKCGSRFTDEQIMAMGMGVEPVDEPEPGQTISEEEVKGQEIEPEPKAEGEDEGKEARQD